MATPENLFSTFTPNDKITGGLAVRIPAGLFPLDRLQDLIGVPLPVHRYMPHPLDPESDQASVEVLAAKIPVSLEAMGKDPGFWQGLAVGLTSNPYYDKDGPYLVFGNQQGELS